MIPHIITPGDGHNDVKCTLAKRVLHDATKHAYDNGNRIKNFLKTRRYSLHVSTFVLERTVEGVLVCDTALRVQDVMISGLIFFML